MVKSLHIRFIFMFVFCALMKATAQVPATHLDQLKQIAFDEQRAHMRLNDINGTTSRLTGSSNFDVKYYRCEWEVDPAVRFIKGKVTLYFVITEAATSLSLDLMSALIVDSVSQRNILLAHQQANNTMQVNFGGSINAGKLDSVSVYYHGVPPDTGMGSFVVSAHQGTAVMWSLSEPYGSRDWWPCKNGLDDKADSIDILITTPAQYKAASNGLLQSETLSAGGTKKTAYWKHRYPIASYLVCFAVTNYTVFNNVVQLGAVNMPMQTYCYPESVASFQNGTAEMLTTMQYFHNLLGDYPFVKEKYGHVQFSWGGGMEHQTASFIVSIVNYLTVHELAHQWFGDKITCKSWQDVWLNEGFATHCTALFYEKFYPQFTVPRRKDDVEYITAQPGGSVKVDDTTNVNRIFDNRLSYGKGHILLYMLRWKLTDSVFFRAIRNYLKDPALAYGFAGTADLKKHLEQESGQDLTKFFKDWYEGQGYPSYIVEWTPVGNNYVNIKMSQTTSHPSVSFFAMPVALQFKNATQQKTIIVDNKINGEIFLSDIGFIADTVLVDPEYWLLSRNNSTIKKASVISGQNIVQVFPNPLPNQFHVYLQNFVSNKVSITLYNAIGQLLYKKELTLANGSVYLDIPSHQLPHGEYNLRIQSGDFKYAKKLIK
jgi:aminopeptidase N